MDETGFSIPPNELALRSASQQAAADVDPPSVELATPTESVAVTAERHGDFGPIEPHRNSFAEGLPVAAYDRNAAEVREGMQLRSRVMSCCPT